MMGTRMPTWVYREMEDHIATLLDNCNNRIATLRRIHARIVVCSMAQSSFLATKLVAISGAANREQGYAELIFEQVAEPNVFLYNAMVRAYSLCCSHSRALGLYRRMMRSSCSPDKFTYPFVLKSCGALVLLGLGRQVHGQVWKSGWGRVCVVENSVLELYAKCDGLVDARLVFDRMAERDVVSWNTLVAAYARLGQLKRARSLFESMPGKTVVSWTVLISGYTMIGRYSEALDVFHRMQLTSMVPDDVAIVSVLPACAHLGALELGRWIHAYCDKNGLLRETHVCNALMEMYAKCGSIDRAWLLFCGMEEKDVISWSTMIGGFAHHGLAQEAIDLFKKMENGTRTKPNSITFLALLSACAHAGLLAEGLWFFDSMVKVHGLVPGVEHYGCMVDLLGRSGCVHQALELISNMPIPPDAAIWGSLLSACKTYGDVKTAIIATEHLVVLEPDDTGNYVILSNIYAAIGRWDGVSKMRKLIRSKNMKKTPGCSLIEVDNVVKEFVAGDDSNSQVAEVSRTLELLSLQICETDTSFDHE